MRKLKTKKQVLEEHSEYKVLINAVVNRAGMDSIYDIINYGIDSGYSGFIYYADTHKFAMRYRKYIILLLEKSAEMGYEGVVEMVKGFGVYRNSPMDKDELKNLYKYL